MNNTVLDKFNINRCDSEIVLISPINGEEIELTNPVILEFINGYKRGLSSEYAFKGDNYEPKRLRLEWTSPVKATVWTVCLAYNTNFEDGYTFHTTEQFLEIDVHFTSKEIYWKVIADDGQLESNVARFTLNRLPENLFIEGVVNARDIGGYKAENGKTVKYGIIYRGAYVDGITTNGKQFVKDQLKISLDLDLRNEGEGSADDISSPLGENVRHILKCGCMYTGNDWSGCEHVGKEGVDIPEGERKLVEELLVFADEKNFPLYTHCVLGRDRTGTLIGVLLALCGVSERDIMLDYELSFFTQSGCKTKEDTLKIIGYFEKVIEYIKTFTGETLQQKTENFLIKSGITQIQIDSIKKNVLI